MLTRLVVPAPLALVPAKPDVTAGFVGDNGEDGCGTGSFGCGPGARTTTELDELDEVAWLAAPLLTLWAPAAEPPAIMLGDAPPNSIRRPARYTALVPSSWPPSHTRSTLPRTNCRSSV